MDQIKKDEQFIQGFAWKDALRPKSPEDLLEDPIIENQHPEEGSEEEIPEEEDEILQKIELR